MPTNSNRREFKLPKSEVQTLSGVAAAANQSRSSILRSIIEGFVNIGSDYTREPTVSVAAIIDPDVVAAAERKALTEYGCPLRDIIRYEIQELAKM